MARKSNLVPTSTNDLLSKRFLMKKNVEVHKSF